ncbi:MAG: DUF2569 domain-containing protein [Azonexus sp.]|nr:DUF2569 domain-containing protein [Azonexus sp.]
MNSDNPYAPPKAVVADVVAKQERQQEGKRLGGWLILVGLGVVLSPVAMVVSVFPVYFNMFSSGHWTEIATPGSENYNALLAVVVLGEITLNGILFIVRIFLAVLFFSKKTTFPKWYIGVMLFSLAFIVADAFMVKLALPDKPVFDPQTAKELGRTLGTCLIWVPYMLVSKRVKETFIK